MTHIYFNICGRRHSCGRCYKDVLFKEIEIRMPQNWSRNSKGFHTLCAIQELTKMLNSARVHGTRKALENTFH